MSLNDFARRAQWTLSICFVTDTCLAAGNVHALCVSLVVLRDGVEMSDKM